MLTNVLDIKHLLHIQDDFRDIFYRIVVLAMALVLLWVLDYPRRKLDKTIDKYIEILEAMKVRVRISQQKEYFLLKRVLYEQKTRDKQNIIAATLKIILEENNVKGTENQETIQKEIMMESEIKPIEDKCLPGEPHQSIFSIGRKRPLYRSTITKTRPASIYKTGSNYKCRANRCHLEHKTKCLSKIKINKYEDVAKTNNSKKNESNKRVAVSSQEHGEIAEHFSPTHPSPDMQKIPLTIPATIVANCEINSFLYDVIQDFDSSTFPFFISNWQSSKKIFSPLSEKCDNEFKHQSLFQNKYQPGSSPTLLKKMRDKIVDSTNEKTSYNKNESKDNYGEKVNKDTETLKTKHSNQRPSDSSIYRVKFNSREKRKKRYSFSKSAKFLEPKFWFKNSEIWERRCKYVLAKLIGPKGDDSLLNLFSLFNKHSHIPILKTSLFSLRKEGNIKNENKSIDVIKKSKNSYLALNHDTKVMKLNSNCKRNYSERKLANNKQNFHELSDKSNILLENVAVGNCFGTCDVSTNSSDIDDCDCIEDLNSSLSDANEFYTANNNNFSQTVSEVQPQSCYHSQFLVEDQLQNKNKKVLKQDHSKTKVGDKCLFRDIQETINKTNKRSEFGISRLDLDNFNNFEESDSLKIWEGIDDHSEVSISRTASKGYEGCEESDQTGYLRDEDSNFDLSIPALEDTGCCVKYGKQEGFESEGRKKTDKLELLEETDQILKYVDKNTTISYCYESCAESSRMDPLEDKDEGSNFSKNRFSSDDYKSYAECDRWQQLREADEDLNLPISKSASGDFKKCSESYKLEPIEEIGEEIFVETNIHTSKVCQKCTEKDSLELVETIYEGNNLFRTNTSTFNSQSSADLIEQYQLNEVEEEETGIKVSYIIKPTISTIDEVTEESTSSNSFTESELAKKIFLRARDGLTGLFNSEKKVANSSLTDQN